MNWHRNAERDCPAGLAPSCGLGLPTGPCPATALGELERDGVERVPLRQRPGPPAELQPWPGLQQDLTRSQGLAARRALHLGLDGLPAAVVADEHWGTSLLGSPAIAPAEERQ